ncbi:MAG: DUF169 domain-containing protein [Chloroflexi bacterium]|nr:DUF169 domain-containing protein [Chloroflexota bacterium]
MADLKKLQQALDTYVRPSQFPVAIKMLKEGEPLPPKVRRPSKDFNEQIAICQGFTFARRYGWSMAIGRDDISCPLAKIVWGFEPMVGYYLNGMTCGGLYTETPAAGAISEAQTAKFEQGQYAYVVAAPLQRAEFAPDLILIYANPAQVMRLVVGALYKRGGRLHASFSGRIDCSDEVIVTLQTNDYQVVLPCNGDRIFAQTQDDEMAFTIPAAKIDELIEGLEATHKNGIRYPIPNWLRYTGRYPESYMKLEEIWREAEKEG